MNEEIVNIGFLAILGFSFIIVGRMFCGKVCPVGIIQDLLYKIPFFIKIKTFKADKYLRWLKYVFIIMNVIMVTMPGFQVAHSDGDSRPSITAIAVQTTLILLAVIIRRPLCKYLCPVGVIGGICNKISFHKYKISADKCNSCGICSKKCKMDIIPYKDYNSIECIKCGCCKKVCPKKTITSNWV